MKTSAGSSSKLLNIISHLAVAEMFVLLYLTEMKRAYLFYETFYLTRFRISNAHLVDV